MGLALSGTADGALGRLSICMRRQAADCAGQPPVTFQQGARLYEKPVLRRFGDLRSLTLIGLGPDGDGGIFGTGYIDGCYIGCSGRS